MTLKLTVGLTTGAVSVTSEALHSATDLAASVLAYFSVRYSDLPPDSEHPYGHGKAESLAALAESVLLFIAALFILYESVHRLITAHYIANSGLSLGLAVTGISVCMNIFLAWHLQRVGKLTDSPALLSDAAHQRADLVTSLGVFTGLTLTRLTGKSWLDPTAAIIVSLFIFRAAYSLMRAAIAPLLDSTLPESEVSSIITILESEPQVLGYHRLRTRKSGAFRHADVHVLMQDDKSLLEAHDLAESIEDRIRAQLSHMQINIHLEPYSAEMEHQRMVHGNDKAAKRRDD